MAGKYNPFSLTPTVGRASAPPDLQPRKIRKEVIQPQEDPTNVVNALVGFAGVAGNEYVKSVEKDLEADRIVQTSLAQEGLMPTDDATRAGYQAHAAVAIKNHSLGAQARLNALAQNDLSDEEWSEAVQEEYRNQDEFLRSNYNGYEENIEMQKLAALSMREFMPQVGAARAGRKVEKEIEDRIDNGIGTLVNAAANPAIANTPVKEMVEVLDGMLGSLQLTESQKDKVIEEAIVQSRSPALIDMASSYKGSRSSSLASRSGKIQQVRAQLEKEQLANQAIAFEKEAQTIEEAVLGTSEDEPSMTLAEAESYVNMRNKETGNSFFSRARWGQLLKQKDIKTAADYVTTNVITAIDDPEDTNLKARFKKSEIQTGYATKIASRERFAKEDAAKKGLEGQEALEYEKNFRQQTQQYIVDKSVKSNELYDAYISDLSAFANTNVAATGRGVDLKGGGQELLFSEQARRTSELIDNMSNEGRRVYLDKLDNDEAEIIKRYLHERQMGKGGEVSGPQALRNAQIGAKNKKPVKWKEVDKAVESIKGDTMFHWFSADIPENMEDYWSDKIREKVLLEPNPNSEVTKTMIKNWMESGVTTTDGGMKLEGSPAQIKEHTNMHIGHLDRAMEAFVRSKSDQIEATLGGLGLTNEDVFPVTEPQTGIMYLSTTRGEISGTRTPMSNLVDIDRKYNHEASKLMWENWQRFERLKAGGPLYVDEEGDPLYD